MRTIALLSVIASVVSLGNLEGSDWNPIQTGCNALEVGLEDSYSFSAALLYWKPYGDELDYAVERRQNSQGNYEDRIHDLVGRFNYGFKLAAEVDMLCSGWDLRADWVHFGSKSSHGHTVKQHEGDLEAFVAIPFIVNSEDTFTSSSEKAHFRSKMRLHYDVLDLEMAHWFFRGAAFSFCPHIGLRTLRVEESFKASYIMDVSLDSAAGRAKNYFEGYGITAGLDMQYRLPCNFTLFVRSAGSHIWGRTKIKHEDAVSLSSGSFVDASDIKETTREGRFMAELHAGISWATQICELYPVFFELAFDQTYLFNQHRFFTCVMGNLFGQSYPTYQHKKNGDLMLQGGSLTMGIEF